MRAVRAVRGRQIGHTGARGRLLCHDQSRDDATRSTVTYASLAFPA